MPVLAMRAKPDCIVCMFRQALNTARLVSDDPELHLKVLARVAETVPGIAMDRTPANLSQPAYEIVSELTGSRDPYAEQKRLNNTAALEVLPDVAAMVAAAQDPLDAALHAAVAGNVIDLGIGHAFDIERDIAELMHRDFAVNAIEDFRRDIGPARKVLYLGDNAGEIVFDTLLVTEIIKSGAEAVFTVKSGPIINDATMADAEAVGMTQLVPVMETGAADIGVDWRNVSDEFREAFESADVIVAKGHGNFETCNERGENIYFLLKAKCAMVAEELGVKLGDIVFRHGGTGQ